MYMYIFAFAMMLILSVGYYLSSIEYGMRKEIVRIESELNIIHSKVQSIEKRTQATELKGRTADPTTKAVSDEGSNAKSQPASSSVAQTKINNENENLKQLEELHKGKYTGVWSKVFPFNQIVANPDALAESSIPPAFLENPNYRHQPHGHAAGVSASIYVHDPDKCRFISGDILNSGAWERSLVDAFMEISSIIDPEKKEYVFDVGANLGFYSIIAGLKGFNVFGFEPMLYNAELFATNIFINKISNKVKLIKVAVLDQPQESICVLPANTYNNIFSEQHNKGDGQVANPEDCEKARKKGASIEMVKVEKIEDILGDDFKTGDKCVSSIKIDIEGFEAKALRGANTILTGKCAPCFIAAEHNEFFPGETHQEPRLVFKYLESIGYKPYGMGYKQINRLPDGTDVWFARFDSPRCAKIKSYFQESRRLR